jgi:hypothetical protein
MPRSKKLSFVLYVLLVLSGSLAVAQDARSHDMLRGKFRFTAVGACTESTGGFLPRPYLQVIPDPNGGTTVLQESYAGTMEFDGRGNATNSYKGITMFDGPFFPNNSAVGTFIGGCQFTYSMIDELSFTINEGFCSGSLPDGPVGEPDPRYVQTYVLTGARGGVGQISRDGDMILISTVEPTLQHIELSGGYRADRFCINNMTLLRGIKRP